jgi:hypothetical protein
MPVIIAHGQPKSGSTFLFATATELRSLIDGDNYYAAMKAALGSDAQAFQARLDAAYVRDVLARAGKKTLVLKTHGPLTDDLRAMVAAGEVPAFTSFRDPRDACKSMLDAGESDRARGSDRWFASKTRAEELVRPIANQVRDLQSWLDCPQVLALPYYIIANNQDFAVRRLCRHLGHGALGSLMAGIMQAKKTTVPEFHKGISDRFLTDFPAEEIVFLNRTMAPQIAAYRRVAAERMAALGHRMLHDRLVAMRQARLAEMGIPGEA